MTFVYSSTNRSTGAWTPQVPRKCVCPSKVFPASRTTRAKSIGNFKLLPYVYPLRFFELHVPSSDEESFTTNMVTLPMTFKVVRIFSRHEIAGSIFDCLH